MSGHLWTSFFQILYDAVVVVGCWTSQQHVGVSQGWLYDAGLVCSTVWVTLIFSQNHRALGKLGFVQSFTCKVAWSNLNICGGWLWRELTSKKSWKLGKYGLYEHFHLFCVYHLTYLTFLTIYVLVLFYFLQFLLVPVSKEIHVYSKDSWEVIAKLSSGDISGVSMKWECSAKRCNVADKWWRSEVNK